VTIDDTLRQAIREELDKQLRPIRERLERPRGALRPDEAGTWLGYSETTIRELMRAGELAYFEVGRSKRIPIAELERFVAERSRRTQGVA
jgi:excisionase family DNA binding protein